MAILEQIRNSLEKGETKTSIAYNEYLTQHRENVRKAFEFIKDKTNVEERTEIVFDWSEHQICVEHDISKFGIEEYLYYDAYFYPEDSELAQCITDEEREEYFNEAWLTHIHENPHHWQHWVLINDDPKEGIKVLVMPEKYVLEMVCDWWSFSWSKGDLREIFDWYEGRKYYIKLHPKTRELVEAILDEIRIALDKIQKERD